MTEPQPEPQPVNLNALYAAELRQLMRLLEAVDAQRRKVAAIEALITQLNQPALQGEPA